MKGKHSHKGFLCFAWWLVVVGAINWGLIGVFNFDLIAAVFGFGSSLTNIVYALIGLSGLWLLFRHCGKYGCRFGANSS